MQVAVSSLGALLSTSLIGRIAQAIGLESVGPALAAMAALTLVLFGLLARRIGVGDA